MAKIVPPRIRAKNFVVYYGYGPLPEVGTFALAVLEPRGWKPNDLAALKERGTKLVGYVSSMEADARMRLEANLDDRDLLRLDGSVWENPEFQTVVVDPRSRRWRSYVIEQVRGLRAAGWDGVFVDGVGTMEDLRAEALRPWLVPALAELMGMMHRELDGRWLIQNNGVWLMLPLVGEWLDGLCWEGTKLVEELAQPWGQALLERLIDLSSRSGVLTLLLSEVAPDAADAEHEIASLTELAREYGFLSYAAPGNYAGAIRLPSGRIVPGIR